MHELVFGALVFATEIFIFIFILTQQPIRQETEVKELPCNITKEKLELL